ncbi:hypothetical protein OWV82_002173 [Melia azedarach]|uniref:Uncharacterized protein n=1 Tax=Melia azedarach TaxID=155640 RepID=A0ACC1Z067_MELAZ|nr:hypothetical protein OWV82_002173 [Melia azedarach]
MVKGIYATGFLLICTFCMLFRTSEGATHSPETGPSPHTRMHMHLPAPARAPSPYTHINMHAHTHMHSPAPPPAPQASAAGLDAVSLFSLLVAILPLLFL